MKEVAIAAICIVAVLAVYIAVLAIRSFNEESKREKALTQSRAERDKKDDTARRRLNDAQAKYWEAVAKRITAETRNLNAQAQAAELENALAKKHQGSNTEREGGNDKGGNSDVS